MHDWINSGILALLATLLYFQKTTITNLKTVIEMLNPDKLKQANDFIRESMDHEVNSKVNKEKKKIFDHVSKRVQQTENQIHQQWEELIHIPFGIMVKMTWPDREKHLQYYPKTAETLREFLKAHDSGELQDFAEKHNNQP